MKCSFTILFFLFNYYCIKGQTYVSGGIFTNTSWTLAGSPYLVSDTLVVFQNVTLTIEPGVTVKLDSQAYFEVRGSLISTGTINDSIEFTSNYPQSTSQQYWWVLYINASLGGKGEFNYSKFEFASTAISLGFGTNGGPLTIRNCTFQNNEGCIFGGMSWEAIIDSCTFIGNTRAIFLGNNILSHSLFIENEWGVGAGTDVYNCTFCGNGVALLGGYNDLQNSVFINNRVGVFNSGAGFTNITGNIFTENDTGIVISSNTSYSNGLGTNNIICNNIIYDLVCYSQFNVSIPYNCWCVTDSLVIRSKIYDGYNNISYGLIDFNPVLNCDTSVLPDSTVCDGFFTEIVLAALLSTEIELFPNPASEKLYINSSGKISQLRIFDLPGKELLLQNVNKLEFEIDTHFFSPGIYFIQLEMENGIVVKKIIKK